MEKISIIIPAYNEEKRIKTTIEGVVGYVNQNAMAFEILISDDGSSDNTANVINKIKPLAKDLLLIENLHAGKAQAVNSALKVAKGDLCLIMDADNATKISELPKLIKALKEQQADIAIASREGQKAQRLNEPIYRHILGRIFNKLVKILVGLEYEDTQCGFKLFKTDVLKFLSSKSTIMNKTIGELKEPLVTAFDVELLALAKIFGYKVIEIPIEWTYYPTENVNPFRDSLRMFLDLLTIKINVLFGKYQK